MSDPQFGGLFSVSKDGAETKLYHNGQLVGEYQENLGPPPAVPRRKRLALDPGRLRGPKLKIERAKRHIEELERAILAFLERCPYQPFHEIDPQTGENVFRMRVTETVPVELGAIVGDAIHNLRTALDYLVCDLARANGKTPHPNGGVSFGRRAKRLKPGSTSKIQGVSAKAERFILRMKASERINSRLFVLNMLDVFDKHNAITTVAAATVGITAKVGVPGMFRGPDGEIRLLGPGPGGVPLMMDAGTPTQFTTVCPLEHNVEIHRSPPGFNEEIETFATIAFGKAEVVEVERQPILETLKEFVNLAEDIIGVFERNCL